MDTLVASLELIQWRERYLLMKVRTVGASIITNVEIIATNKLLLPISSSHLEDNELRGRGKTPGVASWSPNRDWLVEE